MRMFFFTFFFSAFSCFSQQWHYRTLPEEENILLKEYFIGIDSNYTDFKDITYLLPDNYVTDGSVDYTSYLQEAFDKNRRILMPNFPILINDNSLSISSNSEIFFQPKSKLILKTSDKNTVAYYVLLLSRVENIIIYNCNIVGDRVSHNGSDGEWGMGIGIIGSSNIKILGGKINNCWGDGIYIGKFKQKSKKYLGFHSPSENIEINHLIIDNNRRNGISITSGVNVEIKDCLISNTNGTLPMSGIDIEPNSSLDLVKNINLDNVFTFNNKRDGILLVLTRLSSSIEERCVGIEISNHLDVGSYSPLRIGSGFRKDDKKLKGIISIYNSIWKENSVGVRYNNGYSLLPSIKFRNNEFINNKNQKKLSDDKYRNTINLEEI